VCTIGVIIIVINVVNIIRQQPDVASWLKCKQFSVVACYYCRKLAKNYIPKVDRTDRKKEPEYVMLTLHS